MLEDSDPYFQRWFPDGEINIAYNMLDRHVISGEGDRVAIHAESGYTGSKVAWTYKSLQQMSGRVASILKKKFDLKKGDTVIIYMPMMIEAVITMLACARLGVIHSVVFGGFAAKELASRIDSCKPKVIVTTSFGLEPTGKISYPPKVEEALNSFCVWDGAKDIPRIIK